MYKKEFPAVVAAIERDAQLNSLFADQVFGAAHAKEQMDKVFVRRCLFERTYLVEYRGFI